MWNKSSSKKIHKIVFVDYLNTSKKISYAKMVAQWPYVLLEAFERTKYKSTFLRNSEQNSYKT